MVGFIASHGTPFFLSILQLCLHLHNIGVFLQMFDQMHSVGDKSGDEAGYDNILIKRYFF
jgi:hypothetical protein